jgi:hypothetical protein
LFGYAAHVRLPDRVGHLERLKSHISKAAQISHHFILSLNSSDGISIVADARRIHIKVVRATRCEMSASTPLNSPMLLLFELSALEILFFRSILIEHTLADCPLGAGSQILSCCCVNSRVRLLWRSMLVLSSVSATMGGLFNTGTRSGLLLGANGWLWLDRIDHLKGGTIRYAVLPCIRRTVNIARKLLLATEIDIISAGNVALFGVLLHSRHVSIL